MQGCIVYCKVHRDVDTWCTACKPHKVLQGQIEGRLFQGYGAAKFGTKSLPKRKMGKLGQDGHMETKWLGCC